MKGKVVFGALLVSVTLCSQGFGLDLLDRMLGLKCGGCGGCNACGEVACCEEVTACAPEPQCCEEAACCEEPACCEEAACCEEVDCCDPCGKKKRCDLFAGLKGLFDCKRCNSGCETACCEEVEACAPEPECCEEAACCEEPACCESSCAPKRCRKPLFDFSFGCKKSCCAETACCEEEVACCEEEVACCEEAGCGSCGKKCKRPLLDLLDDLFGSKCKKGGCCEEVGCCEATDCGGCGGGGEAVPAEAPAAAEEAAPLPSAPQPDDESAALRRPYSVYQASRRIVRN